MTLKLALFDCDGTLVDSQHAIVAAMEAGFAACHLIAPTAREVRRVVGLPLVEAVAVLVPQLDHDTHEAISEAYKAAFYRNRLAGTHAEPLFEGVVSTLDVLEAAGFLLGVATGKSRRGLDATLVHHGLASRFITLQTSDRQAGKPSPDMVFAALAESGVDAADAVVIGDTTFDILMARNARVRSIGVSWGYHEGAELLAAGADLLVHNYAELPAAVTGLFAGDRSR